MKEMKLEDINPFVRYAQFLTVTSNRMYENIVPYDYRLFYCCGGSGQIRVDGIVYEMKTGSLVCWAPGLVYSLTITGSNEKLELMQINFDYTQNNSDICNPVVPVKRRNFDPDKIIERVKFSDFPEFNSPIFIEDIQFLSNSIYSTVTEFISKKIFYEMRSSGQLKSILSLIGRFMSDSNSFSRSEFLVNNVIRYIRTLYSEHITNRILGEYFGYHPNYSNRLIVRHTGMSVHHYLMTCRIDAAIELLQTSELRTNEISEAVGFNDFSHFLKYFKKLTGKNTRDYRQ